MTCNLANLEINLIKAHFGHNEPERVTKQFGADFRCHTLLECATESAPPRGLLPRRLFARPDVLRGEPVDLHAVPNTAPVKASRIRAPTNASPAALRSTGDASC